MRDEEIQWELEAWKVTVQVQQHFNDIELKVRNLALTLLVAVLGAAGLALREQAEVRILGGTTSLATVLLLAGAVGWGAFYFVDRIWYHRLLLGAVTHGRDIEKRLSSQVPGIGLTESISQSSPYKLWKRWELHSDHKIALFYSAIGALLVVFTVVAHFATAQPESTSSSARCESSATGVMCETDRGSFDCEVADDTLRCTVETTP
jgi:hypothetical protein